MSAENPERSLKIRWHATTAAVLGGALVLFLLSRVSVRFLVDWWWFDSVGQALTFWQRLLYLFAFPVYRMIQTRLLVCLVVLATGLALLYWSESRVLAEARGWVAKTAGRHVGAVLLAAFLIASWDFLLQRNALVYKTSQAPLFYGPGFVDLELIVPLLWAQVVLWGAAVFCLVFAVCCDKGFKLFGVLLAAFLAALWAGHSEREKIRQRYPPATPATAAR
jgi:uncharacterized membrane protein (UPF0182 family)